MAIYFYHLNQPYGSFSNFSAHGFWLQNDYWPTAEHYYQAQKFVGTSQNSLSNIIRQAATPSEAARIGRDPRHLLRPDWEHIKQEVMWIALQAKFLAHPDLQVLLLSTGDEWIVEDSPVDAYWGRGPDGQGKNYLGRLLMKLRQHLRHEQVASLIPHG